MNLAESARFLLREGLLEHQAPGLSLALMLIGTVLVTSALRGRGRLAPAAVPVSVAGVLAWLLSNSPVEGPTLLVVLPGYGVTAADLVAIPTVVLCAALLLRRHRGWT